MWTGKIHFLPKHSYNNRTKKHLDECFYCQGLLENPIFLTRGELITLFLKINPCLVDSINNFFRNYGVPPITNNNLFKHWRKKIICYQMELKDCIKKYEDMNTDRIKSANLKSIASLISLKTKRIICDFISAPNIPTSMKENKKTRYISDNSLNKYTSSKKDVHKAIIENNDVLVHRYSSNNIIDFIWIELMECIKNKIKPKKCFSCGNYYFHQRHKDKNICIFCTPPSRRSAADKKKTNLDSYEMEKFNNSMKKYINRNKDNPNKINQHLLENGINMEYAQWLQSLKGKK